MHGHVGTRVGGGFEEVRGADDARARDAAQVAHDDLLVAVRRIQARADSGGTQVRLQEQLGVIDEALIFLAQRVRERGEFAAQRHRNGVLQLGASHRQDVTELGTLLIEGVRQLVEGLAQTIHLAPQGDAERGRVGVVRRLRAVDVIVGVDHVVAPLLLPQDFEREVRDDLVRVHVHGCARAALELVDGELVHATPVFDDFVAGGDDCLGLDGFHGLELHVRQGARLLNLRKRTNQFGCLIDGAA